MSRHRVMRRIRRVRRNDVTAALISALAGAVVLALLMLAAAPAVLAFVVGLAAVLVSSWMLRGSLQ